MVDSWGTVHFSFLPSGASTKKPTLSQLSTLTIYNTTLSIFIQWIRSMVIRWQSDQLTTKENILPVSDKFITRTKRKEKKRKERLKFCGWCLCFGCSLCFVNYNNNIIVLDMAFERIFLYSITHHNIFLLKRWFEIQW